LSKFARVLGRCPELNPSPHFLTSTCALGDPPANISRDSNRPSRKEKESKSKYSF
jgi:hypothetical protein